VKQKLVKCEDCKDWLPTIWSWGRCLNKSFNLRVDTGQKPAKAKPDVAVKDSFGCRFGKLAALDKEG